MKRYKKAEIYDAGFNHLLEMPHHDLAKFCWDWMRDSDKLELGKTILRGEEEDQ